MSSDNPVKLNSEEPLVSPPKIVDAPPNRKYPEWVTCDDIQGHSNYGIRDKIKISSVLAFTSIGCIVYSIKIYKLLFNYRHSYLLYIHSRKKLSKNRTFLIIE